MTSYIGSIRPRPRASVGLGESPSGLPELALRISSGDNPVLASPQGET